MDRKRKQSIMAIVLILCCAVALRLAVAVYLGDEVAIGRDEQSYSALAERVADGYGYSFDTPWYPFGKPAGEPTSHWSFLYTAYIAGIYAVFGSSPLIVRLIGALVGGILLPLMVYRLSRRAFPERPLVALLALACGAVYAYFVLFAAQLMTETFYIIFLLWSLECALTLQAHFSTGTKPGLGLILSFGLSLGLATLMRQAILPWIAILFLLLLWVGFRNGRFQQALIALTVSGLTLVACIIPFTIRNYLVYDDFLLLNANAGFAMYSAQHPFHGTEFQEYTAAPLPDDLDLSMSEAALDRELMRRGIQFILAEPGRYLLLSASRAVDYFVFWPMPQTSMLNNVGRVLSFGLFLPLMLAGLWLSRRNWHDLWLLYAFMAFYTCLHIFTWAMVRYRLPVDAVLLLFAAVTLAAIWQRVQGVQRTQGIQQGGLELEMALPEHLDK
ncbi:MAG: hypothetical protein KDE48_19685 [Anaerolineales bacterium]|nr:hypothetical protein [Anaerolineales bacterium]